MDADEHLEPLVIPGVDFGDLPTEATDKTEDSAESKANVLDGLNARGASVAGRQHPQGGAAAEHISKHALLSTEPTFERAVSSGPIDPVRDIAIHIDAYTVSEPWEESRDVSHTPDAFRVIEVADSDNVHVDEYSFEIEEPVTEGRRTEVSSGTHALFTLFIRFFAFRSRKTGLWCAKRLYPAMESQ